MERSKIAVITGAGSGIGRAVAVALSQAGWSLVLAGRREAALKDTANVCAGDTLCVPTDVTDEASVAALFEATINRFGRIDMLFNNAGVSAPAVPLEDLDWAQAKAVIDTNVTGAMLCAREAIRVMKAQTPQGGRIINNGSISAYGPRPHAAPYVMSKHAVTGLTKSIILDGRAFGITAAQIDIGNAVTDMSERMASGVLQADGSTRPEPRMDVAHVANTVVHMAGLPPEANMPFVTIMATNMPLYGRG
ncbi:SDR family oxidoreductase [Asticcacaulis machinosus]|uniref:SDR family NAD(P)-dependent oxidoreductase n=1 Tax=Asticcacaulis machinosus TaxID=2984211 RepID=A0ABT5HMU3_9CAUL|nr:SDR family oxidoreductase [Asticcacaulis machinosus]MDC7677572.1 SDR family NAD(P)-dependent oxidoreductase [Asticcacaulis machinosus]